MIDMNLSPRWADALRAAGWDAIPWGAVGDPKAEDETIARWAADNHSVVLTLDLDFGTLLVMTQATAPSVVLIRAEGVRVEQLAARLVPALRQSESALDQGALLLIDEAKDRLRILPLRPRPRHK